MNINNKYILIKTLSSISKLLFYDLFLPPKTKMHPFDIPNPIHRIRLTSGNPRPMAKHAMSCSDTFCTCCWNEWRKVVKPGQSCSEGHLPSMLTYPICRSRHNRLWQILTDSDRSWRVMKSYDRLWQVTKSYDRLGQVLTDYVGLWQLMTGHGDIIQERVTDWGGEETEGKSKKRANVERSYKGILREGI